MSPGWSVTDFALVGDGVERAAATLTCTSAPASLDGPVDVLVVAEEAGTGLECAARGTRYDDPGARSSDRRPPGCGSAASR